MATCKHRPLARLIGMTKGQQHLHCQRSIAHFRGCSTSRSYADMMAFKLGLEEGMEVDDGASSSVLAGR